MKVEISGKGIFNLKIFDPRWPRELRNCCSCPHWNKKRKILYQDFVSTEDGIALMESPEEEIDRLMQQLDEEVFSDTESDSDEHNSEGSRPVQSVSPGMKEVLAFRYALAMFHQEVLGYALLKQSQGKAVPRLHSTVETMPWKSRKGCAQQFTTYPGIIAESIAGTSLLEAVNIFDFNNLNAAIKSAIHTIHLLPRFGVFNTDIQARNFIVRSENSTPVGGTPVVMIDLAACYLIDCTPGLTYQIHTEYGQNQDEHRLIWELQRAGGRAKVQDVENYKTGRFESFVKDEDNRSWFRVMSYIWNMHFSENISLDLQTKATISRLVVKIRDEILDRSPQIQLRWENDVMASTVSLVQREYATLKETQYPGVWSSHIGTGQEGRVCGKILQESGHG